MGSWISRWQLSIKSDFNQILTSFFNSKIFTCGMTYFSGGSKITSPILEAIQTRLPFLERALAAPA
jgi:hypothetical protein